MNKTTLISILLVISVVTIIYIKESRSVVSHKSLKNDSVILAFGDSLTYGFGVSGEYSYPSVLQRKTGLRVINAGVNGEISSEGLKRLPEFLEHKPDLVILCHGGNDILQNLSKDVLKNNLLEMIRLIKKSGSEVLLVAVPDFNKLNFKVFSVYDEVSKESDVMLEDEVLTYIELHRSLKSDYVHPNEKGYEMMADSFIEKLKSYKIII